MKDKDVMAFIAMVGIAIFQGYTIVGKNAEIEELKQAFVEVAKSRGCKWEPIKPKAKG